MTRTRLVRYVLPVALALLTSTRSAPAFTPEQAAAGRAVFDQSCVTCHGANLRQLPGSILAGPEFVAKWGERSTNELLAQTRATMPPDRPGALSEDNVPRRDRVHPAVERRRAERGRPLTAATGARIGAGLDAAVRGARRPPQPPRAPPAPGRAHRRRCRTAP